MDLEREIYNKFAQVLSDKLDGEITAQEMAVVLNFLKHNNIQATTKHEGLRQLKEKVLQQDFDLPFDDEEVPLIKRIK